MPKMIARNSIVVGREGKRVKVPAGTAFDFTAAEIREIEASEPGVLRNPKDESAAVVTPTGLGPDTGEAEAARLKAEQDAKDQADATVRAAGDAKAAGVPAPKVKGAKDDAGGL